MLNNESKFFKKSQIELLFTCNFCHCWSWDDGVSTWIQICAPNIWLLLLLVWPMQVWTHYPTTLLIECEIWIFIQIPIRSLVIPFVDNCESAYLTRLVKWNPGSEKYLVLVLLNSQWLNCSIFDNSFIVGLRIMKLP